MLCGIVDSAAQIPNTMSKVKTRRTRRKLISFSDYKNTAGDMGRLQGDLQSSLRSSLFEIKTMQELHYETLKRLRPFNRVKNTEKSIERAIVKLLTLTGLLSQNTTVHKITTKGKQQEKKKEKDPAHLFQVWILGFDKLPYDQLRLIRPTVETHLSEINDLIKEYERHPEIVRHNSQKRTSRNHRTKTIIDLYNRCLQERQLILDYYLKGVFERAIERSRAHLYDFAFTRMLSYFRDYPYGFGNKWRGRSYDYRDIDCVSHRVSELAASDIPNFYDLYSRNKAKFYKFLFKRRTKTKLFESIASNLEHIPLRSDRTEIFRELKHLFNGKRWLSFYALALPQVEGLFAEMVVAANPDKTTNNSLSDKVKAVRPDFSLSDSYFDYYEYVLPEQRNSFLHTGYDKDFRLKAFDLLTDLEHILSVFAGLENSMVKISKILKERDPVKFSDAKSFAEYFKLLNSLHTKQRKENEAEINEFHEFLKMNCSIEYVADEGARSLHDLIAEFRTKMEYHFTNRRLFIDLDISRKPDFSQHMKDEKTRAEIENLFIYHGTHTEEIEILGEFFAGLIRRLYKIRTGIPASMKNSLATWDSHKMFVKNLNELRRTSSSSDT